VLTAAIAGIQVVYYLSNRVEGLFCRLWHTIAYTSDCVQKLYFSVILIGHWKLAVLNQKMATENVDLD
jgi:hypothetical protein